MVTDLLLLQFKAFFHRSFHAKIAVSTTGEKVMKPK